MVAQLRRDAAHGGPDLTQDRGGPVPDSTIALASALLFLLLLATPPAASASETCGTSAGTCCTDGGAAPLDSTSALFGPSGCGEKAACDGGEAAARCASTEETRRTPLPTEVVP